MAISQGEPVQAFDTVRGYVLPLTTTPTLGSSLLSGLSNGSTCRLINASGAIIYYGSVKSDGTAPATSDMVPLANNLERLIFINNIRNLYYAIASGTGNLNVEVYQ